ncbi:Exportin-5 [Bulinus truncatus]|nr:Exportin-5 [Bulinus truncatus]
MAANHVQLETIYSLIAAVETVMNPLASNENRQTAHKICEEFKENSKQSFLYGFHLAEKDHSAFVRHFGLQVVEHYIKYRWQEAGQTDKSDLKMSILKFVDLGTKDILEEEQHIKDGVSRILVELMKREWPQLWENLFTDFTVVCQNGATQTELVLLTLLRLTEDVVRFQNLPQARRRSLLQALTASMSSISSFFLFTLNTHLEIYKSKTGPETEKACKICQCVLDTLTAFVDWININHITEANLLPLLCSLLLDKNLCLRASECLLLIVGRKGSSEDTGQPPNFEMYLKALLAFTQHPSQILRQMIYTMWLTFLRHPIASQDPVFQSVLPTLIRCGTICLHKVGFPSQFNSVSCDYSRLEFDTDEEFNAVLSCLRVSVVESIRTMTLMVPKLTFSVASAWLTELLNKPIEIGTGADADRGFCNLSSPSFISWDACSVFLEAVMSKLFVGDSDKSFVQEGIDLLHRALAYQMQINKETFLWPFIETSQINKETFLWPFNETSQINKQPFLRPFIETSQINKEPFLRPFIETSQINKETFLRPFIETSQINKEPFLGPFIETSQINKEPFLRPFNETSQINKEPFLRPFIETPQINKEPFLRPFIETSQINKEPFLRPFIETSQINKEPFLRPI